MVRQRRIRYLIKKNLSDRHVNLSFLADPLDSVDYMIKFQFFFQTTYRAYTIHRYKKSAQRGPRPCWVCNPVEDGEGDGKVTAVSITIDGLTGARQVLTVDGPSDPLSGGKSTWLIRA